jgi:hypothetical protein
MHEIVCGIVHWFLKRLSTRTFLHPILRPICVQIGSPSDSLSDFPSDTNLPLSPHILTNLIFWETSHFGKHTAWATGGHGIGQRIGCGIGCKIWRLFFVSHRESYLYPICMKSDGESDRESDAKTCVYTAPNAFRRLCCCCCCLWMRMRRKRNKHRGERRREENVEKSFAGKEIEREIVSRDWKLRRDFMGRNRKIIC